MKRTVFALLLTVLMATTLLSVSACKEKEEEPLDVLIEVYDPYTDELMARQKNRNPTKPEIFIDTIKMYKSDPKVVTVRFFWLRGEEREEIITQGIKIDCNYRYRPKPGESINYYADRPKTSNGQHHVFVDFNPFGEDKRYQRAQMSFYFMVTEEE